MGARRNSRSSGLTSALKPVGALRRTVGANVFVWHRWWDKSHPTKAVRAWTRRITATPPWGECIRRHRWWDKSHPAKAVRPGPRRYYRDATLGTNVFALHRWWDKSHPTKRVRACARRITATPTVGANLFAQNCRRDRARPVSRVDHASPIHGEAIHRLAIHRTESRWM